MLKKKQQQQYRKKIHLQILPAREHVVATKERKKKNLLSEPTKLQGKANRSTGTVNEKQVERQRGGQRKQKEKVRKRCIKLNPIIVVILYYTAIIQLSIEDNKIQ